MVPSAFSHPVQLTVAAGVSERQALAGHGPGPSPGASITGITFLSRDPSGMLRPVPVAGLRLQNPRAAEGAGGLGSGKAAVAWGPRGEELGSLWTQRQQVELDVKAPQEPGGFGGPGGAAAPASAVGTLLPGASQPTPKPWSSDPRAWRGPSEETVAPVAAGEGTRWWDGGPVWAAGGNVESVRLVCAIDSVPFSPVPPSPPSRLATPALAPTKVSMAPKVTLAPCHLPAPHLRAWGPQPFAQPPAHFKHKAKRKIVVNFYLSYKFPGKR